MSKKALLMGNIKGERNYNKFDSVSRNYQRGDDDYSDVPERCFSSSSEATKHPYSYNNQMGVEPTEKKSQLQHGEASSSTAPVIFSDEQIKNRKQYQNGEKIKKKKPKNGKVPRKKKRNNNAIGVHPQSSTKTIGEKIKKANGMGTSKTSSASVKKEKPSSSKTKSTSQKRKSMSSNVPKETTSQEETTIQQQESSELSPPYPDTELYENHRREFERSLNKLERVDQYRLFWFPVPKEFEESYEHCNLADGSTIQFPSHPPFNWEMVRLRMRYHRYVLDRQKQAVEKRQRFLEESVQQQTDKNNNDITDSRKVKVMHPKGIDWDLFKKDVFAMCDAAVERNPDLGNRFCPGTVSYAAKRIKNALEQMYEKTGCRQVMELAIAEDQHRFAKITSENQEAAMQGDWRRDAFPERRYERLTSNVVCAGLSELDERIASYELRTSLQDMFVGLSYKYDDTDQSEEWMKCVLNQTEGGKKNFNFKGTEDETNENNNSNEERQQAALALAADDGVIRAQVATSMSSLLTAVQDRVMTENGVLHQPELRSANWMSDGQQDATINKPEVVETPVWGIDCYTRRNITECLTTDFDTNTSLLFIEKWLLPAINACPVDLAHNISNAALILEGLPFGAGEGQILSPVDKMTYQRWRQSLLGKALRNKIERSAPPWLKPAAQLLRRACDALGLDFFRVHPKGHGSVVISPLLEANTLVTFYRGEVYPSWRWGEKMDAIEITQKRKALKPSLPDFYNMVLERPQSDPRQYGLLFVDASRKAGHGSSLSHSCEPTCEVRVSAVKGELCLSMTTLRQIEMGEELTFDYNAVTESLDEYQSAVCLCGYGKCRGSFLHFATADCYQQVLNRNSPIAIRFANLAKGCMKKVMADDDEKVLQNHGFATAIFGAVSMNQRNASGDIEKNIIQDTMDIIPVWLRTFVADTLRYIEYERRALPISLLCDHLSTVEESKVHETSNNSNAGEQETSNSNASNHDASNSNATKLISNSNAKKRPSKKRKIAGYDSTAESAGSQSNNSTSDESSGTDEESKAGKNSSPEEPFIHFLRTRRQSFYSLLLKNGFPKTITGVDLNNAIEKVASSHWDVLGEKDKLYWKERAIEKWEKDTKGRPKARVKKERRRSNDSLKSKSKKKQEVNSDVFNNDADDNDDDDDDSGEGEKDEVVSSKISFQAADAEGAAAMEQRIQQLAQTLSRVGRVLYRHREASIESDKIATINPETFREVVQSPLTVASDGQIVSWMWNHEDGIVRSLLAEIETAGCASPSLKETVKATKAKYGLLEKFGHPSSYSTKRARLPMMPSEGRRRLNAALMEFRCILLNELHCMSEDFKTYKARIRNVSSRQRFGLKKSVESNPREVSPNGDFKSRLSSSVPNNDCGKDVMGRLVPGSSASVDSPVIGSEASRMMVPSNENLRDVDEGIPQWLHYYSERFKIQKAADLLLVYANTSTFFLMQPYKPLESTPVEVYARELGNAVPRSAIDTALDAGVPNSPSSSQETAEHPRVSEGAFARKGKLLKSTKFCKPDDIVAEVAVKYQGDYVLSQLLQWYNGGIGQKPGLPDILGCILLPLMAKCWKDNGEHIVKGKKSADAPTEYEKKIRSKLIDWLREPHQRGNPWPKEVQRSFTGNETGDMLIDTSSMWLPFGSPILDLLVTGDDSNIRKILYELGGGKLQLQSNTSGDQQPKSAVDSLLSATVDQGRPAQAVSNWVQCENPACLKWRKVPWHVDIDILSKHFVCSNNRWNPSANTCDAPEDEWDTADNVISGQGPESPKKVKSESSTKFPEAGVDQLLAVDVNSLFKGNRLDVRRSRKKDFCVGRIIDLDLESEPKKVKFHFPKMKSKFDEWIEVGSDRIAPLGSKTQSAQKPLPVMSRPEKEFNGKCQELEETSSLASEKSGPQQGFHDFATPKGTDKESTDEEEISSLIAGKSSRKQTVPVAKDAGDIPCTFTTAENQKEMEPQTKDESSRKRKDALYAKDVRRIRRKTVLTDDSDDDGLMTDMESTDEDEECPFASLPEKSSQKQSALATKTSKRIPRKCDSTHNQKSTEEGKGKMTDVASADGKEQKLFPEDSLRIPRKTASIENGNDVEKRKATELESVDDHVTDDPIRIPRKLGPKNKQQMCEGEKVTADTISTDEEERQQETSIVKNSGRIPRKSREVDVDVVTESISNLAKSPGERVSINGKMPRGKHPELNIVGNGCEYSKSNISVTPYRSLENPSEDQESTSAVLGKSENQWTDKSIQHHGNQKGVSVQGRDGKDRREESVDERDGKGRKEELVHDRGEYCRAKESIHIRDGYDRQEDSFEGGGGGGYDEQEGPLRSRDWCGRQEESVYSAPEKAAQGRDRSGYGRLDSVVDGGYGRPEEPGRDQGGYDRSGDSLKVRVRSGQQAGSEHDRIVRRRSEESMHVRGGYGPSEESRHDRGGFGQTEQSVRGRGEYGRREESVRGRDGCCRQEEAVDSRSGYVPLEDSVHGRARYCRPDESVHNQGGRGSTQGRGEYARSEGPLHGQGNRVGYGRPGEPPLDRGGYGPPEQPAEGGRGGYGRWEEPGSGRIRYGRLEESWDRDGRPRESMHGRDDYDGYGPGQGRGGYGRPEESSWGRDGYGRPDDSMRGRDGYYRTEESIWGRDGFNRQEESVQGRNVSGGREEKMWGRGGYSRPEEVRGRGGYGQPEESAQDRGGYGWGRGGYGQPEESPKDRGGYGRPEDSVPEQGGHRRPQEPSKDRGGYDRIEPYMHSGGYGRMGGGCGPEGGYGAREGGYGRTEGGHGWTEDGYGEVDWDGRGVKGGYNQMESHVEGRGGYGRLEGCNRKDEFVHDRDCFSRHPVRRDYKPDFNDRGGDRGRYRGGRREELEWEEFQGGSERGRVGYNRPNEFGQGRPDESLDGNSRRNGFVGSNNRPEQLLGRISQPEKSLHGREGQSRRKDALHGSGGDSPPEEGQEGCSRSKKFVQECDGFSRLNNSPQDLHKYGDSKESPDAHGSFSRLDKSAMVRGGYSPRAGYSRDDGPEEAGEVRGCND